MKDVKGYEKIYSITESGDIVNKITGAILKQCKNSKGYGVVILSNNGNKKTFLSHRLVCLTYKPETYFKGACVNHINGDKMDNRPCNLEWVTQSENQIHAYRTGLQKPSINQKKATSEYCINNFSKKVVQKNMDGDIVNQFKSASEASRITGFKQTHISSVCRGKVKFCHNFKFEYENK